jgi:uncharacterized integral membrane protein
VSKWVLWIIVPSELFIILVFSLIFGANMTNNPRGGGGGPSQPVIAWVFYAGLGGMVIGMIIVIFRAFRQTRQVREALAAKSHLQVGADGGGDGHYVDEEQAQYTTTQPPRQNDEKTSLLNRS